MAANQWIKRKARVGRTCQGWYLAKSCGCWINPGDTFYQSTHRAGLDRAELCEKCAAKKGVTKCQPSA